MGIERRHFGVSRCRKVRLESKALGEQKQAHLYLREKMHLPAFYRNNLQALYTCLCNMQDLEITLVYQRGTGAYYDKVRRVFWDAKEQNESLKILECEGV